MKCQVCGCDVGGKARSYQHHKRFFAMIEAYFDHWPDRCDFQPDSAEHLRAWALVKAKHRNVIEVLPGGKADIDARYSWEVSAGGHHWLVWPRSISYEALPHKDAVSVFSDVEAVLEHATGINVKLLMREQEAAA